MKTNWKSLLVDTLILVAAGTIAKTAEKIIVEALRKRVDK